MLEKIERNLFTIDKRYHALAVALAFCRAFSIYFFMGRDDMLNKYEKILVFGIRLIGYCVIFELIIILLNWLIKEKRMTERLIDREQVDCGNGVWKDYFIFAVAWLPGLIIKYPGAMCWDTWRMLYEFRNERITAHHSVFYTVCLGSLVEFFEKKVGHANWGLFIFVFFQYVFTVLAFGYSIQLLRKLHVKKRVINAIIVLWLINPYLIGYHGVAIKDYSYAVCLFLMTALLIEMRIDEKKFCRDKRKFFLLGLAVTGSCLLRKNGYYIIFILITVCLAYIIRHKMKHLLFMAIVLFYMIAVLVSGALGKQYHVTAGSVGEALSLPFQQTARYVKYYGNDITMEEREIIDRVLDYDSLSESYSPRISDPVKNKYKGDESALLLYFKVWFKQFWRHPFCYLSATWEQNYYLFVPEASKNSIVFYQDTNVGYELGDEIIISEKTGYYEPIFSTPAILSDLQKWVISEYNLLHQIPIISAIGNISFYVYLLAGMIVVMVVNKKEWLLVFFPAIATFVFVILGPAIQGHPRYVFPVIYSTPVLLAYVCFVSCFKNQEKQ